MIDVPLMMERALEAVSAKYVAGCAEDHRETAKTAFDAGVITGVKAAGIMTMIAHGANVKEIKDEFNTGV